MHCGKIIFTGQIPNLKKRVLRQWIFETITRFNKTPGFISINIVDDYTLLDINQQFLKHNVLTDIITFDYSEGHVINGELFLSIDRIKENAKKFKVKLEYELARVLIHGILHLLGFMDSDLKEKEKMTNEENKALENLFKKNCFT